VTVTQAHETGLTLENGEIVPCDASLWATRAMPHAYLSASDLVLASDGFIAVDEFQRSRSHQNVFAVGDCASREGAMLPKAGVVPVKQGPWLVDALASCGVGSNPPSPFTFQKNSLALLALGGKRATGVRGPYSFTGAWVWHWKDWIDRRFMRKYG
jgi:selenide, water dikinase